MTYAIVKNSDGDEFIVSNTVKNSDGTAFVVNNAVKNSDGTLFIVFTASVITSTPTGKIFISTGQRVYSS